jgi:hypothetical protein
MSAAWHPATPDTKFQQSRNGLFIAIRTVRSLTLVP